MCRLTHFEKEEGSQPISVLWLVVSTVLLAFN